MWMFWVCLLLIFPTLLCGKSWVSKEYFILKNSLDTLWASGVWLPAWLNLLCVAWHAAFATPIENRLFLACILPWEVWSRFWDVAVMLREQLVEQRPWMSRTVVISICVVVGTWHRCAWRNLGFSANVLPKKISLSWWGFSPDGANWGENASWNIVKTCTYSMSSFTTRIPHLFGDQEIFEPSLTHTQVKHAIYAGAYC